jgi:hypothetical protein
MSILHIPKPITNLITNLCIVSLLEKNQKLNLKTMSFSDKTTWGQTFYRFYYRESRHNLIDYLKALISESILAIQDFSGTEYLPLIVNHLNLAKTGLENLIETYKDDPKIVAELKIIMENIEIVLDKNCDQITPNFKSIIMTDRSVPFPKESIITESQTFDKVFS